MLVQWNIETGQSDKYEIPPVPSPANGGHAHGKKGGPRKGSKHILTVAVSSDGRYLASGGLDRAVHLWDTRTRQHLQVVPLSLFSRSSMFWERVSPNTCPIFLLCKTGFKWGIVEQAPCTMSII